MPGRGRADGPGAGDSVESTASVGAALATGADEGPTEADGTDVGAATPLHAATARAKMTTAAARHRGRWGPGGRGGARRGARGKRGADDARVTAFELLGDGPRAAACPELRLRS